MGRPIVLITTSASAFSRKNISGTHYRIRIACPCKIHIKWVKNALINKVWEEKVLERRSNVFPLKKALITTDPLKQDFRQTCVGLQVLTMS